VLGQRVALPDRVAHLDDRETPGAELGELARGTGWRLTSARYADQANYLAVIDLDRS